MWNPWSPSVLGVSADDSHQELVVQSHSLKPGSRGSNVNEDHAGATRTGEKGDGRKRVIV